MTILWNNGENDGLALELGGELIFKVYIFKAGLGSQQYHGWTFLFESRFFRGGGGKNELCTTVYLTTQGLVLSGCRCHPL